MKEIILIAAMVFALSVDAQERKEKPDYSHFRSVTAEARAKGECVKSLATGKIYSYYADGRWGRCAGPNMWDTSDSVLIEFYSDSHKAGRFEVVKCELCK